MQFIIENLGSILLCLGLAAILSLVAVRLVRNRHTGCSGCGGACSGCAMRGSCHPKKEKP
jgi:hypothetical protein